jgi:hypothetical protein
MKRLAVFYVDILCGLMARAFYYFSDEDEADA